MIKHFVTFDGSPYGRRSEKARVTLGPKKTILLNRLAHEAFGTPAAVELLFDENAKQIGLKPCDPHRRNAFPLTKRKDGNHRIIHAGAFCTHFGIATDRTVLFEEIDIDTKGMMILDMTKTVNVGRGAR